MSCTNELDSAVDFITDNVSTVAPVVASVFFPALAPAIGASLGATGAAAGIVGGAVIGGASAALGGENPIKGALTGGLSAGASQLIKSYAGDIFKNMAGDASRMLTAQELGALAEYPDAIQAYLDAGMISNDMLAQAANAFTTLPADAQQAYIAAGYDPVQIGAAYMADNSIDWTNVKNVAKNLQQVQQKSGVNTDLLNSLIQGGASIAAGEYGARQAEKVLEEQKRQFDIGQENMRPWLDSGKTALQAQMALLGLGSGYSPAPAQSQNAPALPTTPTANFEDLTPEQQEVIQKIIMAQTMLNLPAGASDGLTPEQRAQYEADLNLPWPGTEQEPYHLMDDPNFKSTNPNYLKNLGLFNKINDLAQYGLNHIEEAKQNQQGTEQLNIPQSPINPSYSNSLAELVNSPGYQFRIDQGNQTINRSAAAKGMLNSGNVLAELANYGQGVASEEYGKRLNQLASVAGTGQTASTNMATAGQNYGINYGNSILAGAASRQSGILGAGQALSSFLNPLATNY